MVGRLLKNIKLLIRLEVINLLGKNNTVKTKDNTSFVIISCFLVKKKNYKKILNLVFGTIHCRGVDIIKERKKN